MTVTYTESNEMRLAVIADIHGILPALEAVLKEIERENVAGIIVAGDMVAGPNPVEVVSTLRKYNCWMIRGNNENYILRFASGAPEWWYTCRQWAFMRWNYENIDKDTLELLRTLPEQRVIHLAGTDAIRVVHGSPHNISELIYPDQDISKLDAALEGLPEPVVLFGHSHQAWQMQRNGKLALNPGSLCMSYNGEHCGSYAVLSWKRDRWSAEIRTLYYNVELAREAYTRTGLLEKGGAFARFYLRDIENGINSLPLLVDYAYQKAAEAGFADSPFVPDHIWDEAARSFEEQYQYFTKSKECPKTGACGEREEHPHLRAARPCFRPL